MGEIVTLSIICEFRTFGRADVPDIDPLVDPLLAPFVKDLCEFEKRRISKEIGEMFRRGDSVAAAAGQLVQQFSFSRRHAETLVRTAFSILAN